MLERGSINPEVCVVGRCNFGSGIGLLTYGFAEALSRYFPTCILPTEPHLREKKEIVLPNGRRVPVQRGGSVKATFFVDVLWNGTHDYNYKLVPEQGLRIACFVWDSDLIPSEWATILNNCFDLIAYTSPHLDAVLRRSGVVTPAILVPPGLDLEPLMAQPYRWPRRKIRVLSVSAFHPRKGTQLLLDAFLSAFASNLDVELVLHSNLSIGFVRDDVRRIIDNAGAANVVLSTDDLSIDEKSELIASCDVFANFSRGEGYSIGPREALALGKCLALSHIGGHQELRGPPGVFFAVPSIEIPARYPEIDGRIFGRQQSVTLADAQRTLEDAVAFARTDRAAATASARRTKASEFAFARTALQAASVVEPSLPRFRGQLVGGGTQIVPAECAAIVRRRLSGLYALKTTRRRIVPMHDGGFFSIFNAYFSNLVWDMRDDRCHRTLPDWDVQRFLKRQGDVPITSFCYGIESDGNIWTKLFEPLFGLTADEMNDHELLYDSAVPPDHIHNGGREPLGTYIHAAELYRQPWFIQMRRQYNRVWQRHVQLEKSLHDEIENFACEHFEGRRMFGAHVRHPSHTVEQPGGLIAHCDHYIEEIQAQVAARGRQSDDWGVFLATDQDRVVNRMQEVFGDRLTYWPAIRRTTEVEDARFDKATNKHCDGFQLQHIVASSRSGWSLDMAREVIRDAVLMSRCSSLLHVVSNVSTAVSFMNPAVDMIYLKDR